MDLRGQNVVVVGAGGAIGTELCGQLLANQAQVIALGHNYSTLEHLPTPHKHEVDATSEVDVRSFFQKMASQNIFINGVINVVGIHHIAFLEDISVEEWDRVFTTNVRSAFLTAKWAVKTCWAAHDYSPSKPRTLINIASKAATRPMRCSAPYNASKAAMRMLSFQQARELSRHKVSVVCVSPGIIGDVPMSFDVMDDVCNERGWTKEHAMKYQMDHIPWGEMATTKQVAAACVFACRPDMRQLTGDEMQITGAQY